MTQTRPSRHFVGEDILAGRVSLDGYPFRYVYITIPLVVAPFGGAANFPAKVDGLFTAVEYLETRGWQLVNFEMSGRVAYMRNLAR